MGASEDPLPADQLVVILAWADEHCQDGMREELKFLISF